MSDYHPPGSRSSGFGFLRALLWLWGKLPIPNLLRWWIVYTFKRKFLIGVVAVVWNDQDEVLLFRHTYRPRWPWGLPSGLLERGENPARAIEREITEETGLTVRALCPVLVLHETQVSQVDLVYRGQFEGGTFRPSAEVSEARFFPRGALPNLPVEQLAILDETPPPG